MEINEKTAPADALAALNRGERVTYHGHEITEAALCGTDRLCCFYEQDGKRERVIV